MNARPDPNATTDFDLKRAPRRGCPPLACASEKPQDYLNSYAATYLREEVQQEEAY